jgi:(2Fe-2S) ferredoxin
MYWTKKHVLVCTASHCAQKGANEVVGKLRLDIVRKRLDSEILINNCGTIDLCDIGPNMVIYPDNIILSGVTTKDIPAIIRFLQDENQHEGVAHLRLSASAREEQRRRELFAEAVATSEALTVDRFTQLIADHGFASDWTSEQKRRGFIAVKPDQETDQQIVTVTSKARTRYGL